MSQDQNPYLSPRAQSGTLPRFGKRQSWLGVASFSVALLAVATEVGSIVAVGALSVMAPDLFRNAEPVKLALSVGLFIGFVFDLSAVIIGAAALFQRDRKRRLAIFGIVIGGITIVLVFCVGGIATVLRARPIPASARLSGTALVSASTHRPNRVKSTQ